jgi:hypothetical protein
VENRRSENRRSKVRLNRRRLLCGCLTCLGPRAFAAADFWNRKPSSAWSAEEIEQLRSKSPWSRKVRSEVSGGAASTMDREGSRGSFGGMSGADSNGISVTSGGSRGGRPSTGLDGPASIGGTQAWVVVCWESARPLLDAAKVELPSSFRDHYAVSLTGMPFGILRAELSSASPETPEPAARQKAAVDYLLAQTTLTAHGRPPVAAGFMVQNQERQSLIFAFRRQNPPLQASDREVTFAMNLRTIRVKAKFEMKEMLYRGALAL